MPPDLRIPVAAGLRDYPDPSIMPLFSRIPFPTEVA